MRLAFALNWSRRLGGLAAAISLVTWLTAVAPGSAMAEAGPRPRPWTEYRTILWMGDTAFRTPEKLPLFFERLREMGINTAMVAGNADASAVRTNGFPYYVENMVNRGLCLKWNSGVADWEKFVTAWAGSGRPDAALVRDYSLDDPDWLGWAENQMRQQARRYRQDSPVAYDIRDELSVTISANPFDYDFSPITLGNFRDWLKLQYGDLERLNAAWETRFATWDEVRPFTTDQIKQRMASGQALGKGAPDWQALQRLTFRWPDATDQPTRWNFSPWADFRTYMDLSLARALARLREAARTEDPHTPVGIEGTQMPHAFGGYDLWRLAQSVDWVEPYDIGNAREIFGSFMDHPLMTTVFESETHLARRRLWHLLLEGDGGCIVWWSEDCIDWQSADWRLSEKARALAPVLREMTSPLARLFLRAQREHDPVFLHYSQPSLQVAWLIESTADGSTWLRRFSSYEANHSRMAKVRGAWLKLLQDLGYSPRFVAGEQIEAGALRELSQAVLVLPSSWALSDLEAREIRSFLGPGGGQQPTRAALWNGTPGVFDQHGRLRSATPLGAWLADGGVACVRNDPSKGPDRLAGDIVAYGSSRLKGGPETARWSEWAKGQLRFLPPAVQVPSDAGVRVHRFRIASARLLAFERNIHYQMSEELKQAGGNERLEQPIQITAAWDKPGHVYELRTGRYLGQVNEVCFRLDPWQPSLFALTPHELPGTNIVAALLGR